MTPLGESLASARSAKGLLVRTVASSVGCSQGHIENVERGESTPSERIVRALAALYGVGDDERERWLSLRSRQNRFVPRKWSREHRENAERAFIGMVDATRSELTAARVAAGLTGTKLASMARGCTKSLLAGLETGRYSPIRRRDGGWRPVARTIACALDSTPEELWPDVAPMEPIDYSDDRTIPTPEDIALARDRDRTVRLFLLTLPLEQQRVLHLRFGFTGDPKTLDECGDEIGAIRERARQIEARALRALRTRFHRIYSNIDLDEKQS